MDPISAVEMAKSLVELVNGVAGLVARAATRPRVELRVIGYLEAANQAVRALGLERQRILTDVRRCDLRDSTAVGTLARRLDTYLHEDNIRPHLEAALGGLRGCFEQMERQSEGLVWRRRDKARAFAEFAQTLRELQQLIEGLVSDFLPGASGMGVQTLVPIHQFLEELTSRTPTDADDESLAELSALALADPSHVSWITVGGQVETLVLRLQFAFRVDDR